MSDQEVKASSLSKKLQSDYAAYRTKQSDANTLGAALAKAAKAEWDAAYPDGVQVEGETKFCSFSANFGKLRFEYVARRRGKGTPFDADAGVDVFPR